MADNGWINILNGLKPNGVEIRRREMTEQTEITEQTEVSRLLSGLFPFVPFIPSLSLAAEKGALALTPLRPLGSRKR